jgi:GNAT superfamily N-acetyltransferase
MDISIRAATPADAPRVAELLGQLGYAATAEEARVRLAAWAADERSMVIAADVGGVLAGVAAVHAIPLLEQSGSRGRLVALVVDETCRRHGIAGVLIESAEAQARLLGCLDMEVTSARDRPAAHAFYVSAGYDDVCARAARYLKPLAAD